MKTNNPSIEHAGETCTTPDTAMSEHSSPDFDVASLRDGNRFFEEMQTLEESMSGLKMAQKQPQQKDTHLRSRVSHAKHDSVARSIVKNEKGDQPDIRLLQPEGEQVSETDSNTTGEDGDQQTPSLENSADLRDDNGSPGSEHSEDSESQSRPTGRMTGPEGHHDNYRRKNGRSIGLERRLHTEIDRKPAPHQNEQGFIPCKRFRKILSLRVLERELMRHDKFLADEEKRDATNTSLRFPPLKGSTRRRKAMRAAAKAIYGKRHTSESTGRFQEPQYQDSYLKVWATLVLIEQPTKIKLFVDKGVGDEDLPLELIKTPIGLRRKSPSAEPLTFLDEWDPALIQKFAKYQWHFLAPYFHKPTDKYVVHHILEQNHILPFVFYDKNVYNGGFSCIHQAVIHSEHHNFEKSKIFRKFIAVKCLKPAKKEVMRISFNKEVAVLRRLTNSSVKHLVTLLGTYEQFGSFYLIFPWAEHTLLNYWRCMSVDAKDKEKTLAWLAKQCNGISAGLEYIHRFKTSNGNSLVRERSRERLRHDLEAAKQNQEDFIHLHGRHGDVNPNNILWYPTPDKLWERGRGILKLADFGTAEFRTQSPSSYMNEQTPQNIAESRQYRPPETDFKDEHIGPSYDIWSLGCVFLEFFVWWFGGWNLVEEFADQRVEPDPTWRRVKLRMTEVATFFRANDETGFGGAEVKPSVSQRLIELEQQARFEENAFAQGFLNMIKEDMLVVQQSVDSQTKTGRKSAKRICEQLGSLRDEQGWTKKSKFQTLDKLLDIQLQL